MSVPEMSVPEMSVPEMSVELAVVGAGVSGLTVMRLLLESNALAGRSVLLVDGARDDDELRTLSFWSPGPIPLEPLVRHRWSTLRLHTDPGAHDPGGHELLLAEHTYRSLFFADLQRDVKQRLAARPDGHLVEGRVQGLVQDGDGVTLTVARLAGGDLRVRARWVLDSRFHLRDHAVDRRRFHDLRQHFHGWIVRAPRDAFTPDVATLLDFRTGAPAAVPPGTGFVYVLPFSPREALVELVTLHPVDAEPVLHDYLLNAHGLAEVELLDRESGVSPLTDRPFPWHQGRRVRLLGVASGRLKPSTGYALTRIVDDCAAIVRSLERDGHPMVAPADAPGHRLLDGVLLELWERRPEAIPGVFAAMFLRNPPDRVLRFLDERESATELARLIGSLPWTPFLGAAVRWLARRARAPLGRPRPAGSE
jgi:lycopene beta-cyclase